MTDMEIFYVPGTDADFVLYIAQHKARWEAVDGHFRWIITREDGTEYIARPESTKNEPS